MFAAGAVPAVPPSGGTTGELLAPLEKQLAVLIDQYAKSDEAERKATVDQRITDGEILFLLGDYVRAGIVLYDVCEDRANETHKLFDQALYYLAESSFHTRNFLGARLAFTRLLVRGKNVRHFEAFGRLVEIADILGDYTAVEATVQGVKGKLRPDVAYIYGKSLVRRARDTGVLKHGVAGITQLLTLDPTHKYYGRARYAIGVELIRQKRYDEAIREFRRLLALKDPLGLGADKSEVTQLRELSILAIARVQGEQNKLDDAVTTYLTLDRKSPLMPQMLYETAWLYASQNALKKSLQMIELLLLTPEDPALVPSAKVLKANVLLKLARYPEATEAYRDVNKIYEPVYAQLNGMRATDFNAVIAKNRGSYDAKAFLPPLAAVWATGEREVGQALGLAHDLAMNKTSLREAKAVGASLLETKLVYPQQQAGEEKARVIEERLRPFKGPRVVAMQTKLRTFRASIAAQYARRTVLIRAAVEKELRLLDGYDKELRAYDVQAQTLVDRVARDAFEDVRRKLYTLVLQGDVGLVDVAWQQKEDETNDINDLITRQKAESDAAERRFGEALRE